MQSKCFEYKYASLDKLALMVTIFVVLMEIVLIGVILYLSGISGILITVFLLLVLLSPIISVIPFVPRKLLLCMDGLTIVRVAGNIRIDKEDIADIRIRSFKPMHLIRLFASGGLFGYIGRFRIRGEGTASFYATNLSKAIEIILKDGKRIVVSPENPEQFISMINGLWGWRPGPDHTGEARGDLGF